MAIKYAVMSVFFMMWQCISEERGKMDFMGMKSCVHSYLDRLCLACNLETTISVLLVAACS